MGMGAGVWLVFIITLSLLYMSGNAPMGITGYWLRANIKFPGHNGCLAAVWFVGGAADSAVVMAPGYWSRCRKSSVVAQIAGIRPSSWR